MANVPWHEEVVHFVQQLADLLPDYGIACEHEHSNCLLLAHHQVITTQLSHLPDAFTFSFSCLSRCCKIADAPKCQFKCTRFLRRFHAR